MAVRPEKIPSEMPAARRQRTSTRPARVAMAPAGQPGERDRPLLLLGIALILAAIAAWRISLPLIAPPLPEHSILAFLGEAAPATLGDVVPAPDAAAIDRARSAVEREPLDAEAYAVLALGAQQAGQDETARTLMRIAAAWWPRDILVQSWLMAQSLRRGDMTAAVATLDTIARGRPDSLDAMTEAVAPLLRDPAAANALADLLATSPPWRTRFIDIAVRQWREPAGLIALMDRLQARPPGLDPMELRVFLNKLWASGDIDHAYLSWLRSLPRDRLGGLGFLYNGKFQQGISNMPFDWQTPVVPGTVVSLGEAANERILTVGFLGARVALQPILHHLILSPGSYRFSGRVHADRLRAERGVRWRLSCVEAPDRVLASSDSLAGVIPWRDFAMVFVIPDSGCRAQTLGLDVEARSALEQSISGVVAFSQLDIVPR